jgi:protein-tyrosine phosphatase
MNMASFSTKSLMKKSLINEYGLERSSNLSCDEENSTGRKLSPLVEAIFVMKMVQTDGSPAAISEFPNIFIGSVGCAYNKQGLLDAGITHILCLTNLSRLKFPELFSYKRIPMKDSIEQDISAVVSECIDFIDMALSSANGKILVHCYKGVSRCASICIAFLMERRNMSCDDALALIRETRPQACPNIHFVLSLRRLGAFNGTAAEVAANTSNCVDEDHVVGSIPEYVDDTKEESYGDVRNPEI